MRDFDEIDGPPELTDGTYPLASAAARRQGAPSWPPSTTRWRVASCGGRRSPTATADFDEFYSASLTFWDDFGLSVWIIADAG